MLICYFVGSFFIGWWAANDAHKRGFAPWEIAVWFFGCWLFWVVFIPIYFILRARIPGPLPGKPSFCPFCDMVYYGKVDRCSNCNQEL